MNFFRENFFFLRNQIRGGKHFNILLCRSCQNFPTDKNFPQQKSIFNRESFTFAPKFSWKFFFHSIFNIFFQRKKINSVGVKVEKKYFHKIPLIFSQIALKFFEISRTQILINPINLRILKSN